MAYSSGGLIEAVDYNNRVNALNSIWGAGSGANGYGQTSTTLSTTSTSAAVTATQWASLIARLDAITVHQTGVTSSISQPTAGTTIAWLSTIDTKVAATYTNRLAVSFRGAQNLTAVGTVTNSTGWYTSSTKEFSYTFSSTDTVRYFFNAGGLLSMNITQAAGANIKSTDWSNFYTNQVGVINFGYSTYSRSGTGGDANNTVPGNPAPPTSGNIGWSNLTSVYQTLFYIGSTTATGYYGNNYITIEAKLGATSNIIVFRFISYDVALDSAPFRNLTQQIISGANTVNVGWTPPETTYLTNVWGTPAGTTITNTQG
jgi:hypothetical protein